MPPELLDVVMTSEWLSNPSKLARKGTKLTLDPGSNPDWEIINKPNHK